MADAFLDGMTLVAIAQDDRDGAAAVGALAPALAGTFAARLAELAAMDRAQRRAEVRRMAARLDAVPVDADLPHRARALLVGHVPKDVARGWAAAAPKVRRGFSVTPGIKRTLRRLAVSADPTAEADERSAARLIDERLPARAAALRGWARELARGEDEERVLGALALGVLDQPGGDASSRPWRRFGRDLRDAWAAAASGRREGAPPRSTPPSSEAPRPAGARRPSPRRR